MQGLFPWLRERLFGNPRRLCKYDPCDAEPSNRCVNELCVYHCKMNCYDYRQDVPVRHGWHTELPCSESDVVQ